MFRFAPVAVVVLSCSAVAAVADPLTVRAGETVSLSISDSGTKILSREMAPPLTAFEAEGLGKAQATILAPGAKTAPPVGIDHTEAPPPEIIAKRLQITFRQVPSRDGSKVDSFLVLENGYEHFVRYRAFMRRGENSRPTDVCDVLPGRTGFEHWPHQLDAVELSDFQLVDSTGQVECQ